MTGQHPNSSDLDFMDIEEDEQVEMIIDEIAEYQKRGEQRGG